MMFQIVPWGMKKSLSVSLISIEKIPQSTGLDTVQLKPSDTDCSIMYNNTAVENEYLSKYLGACYHK